MRFRYSSSLKIQIRKDDSRLSENRTNTGETQNENLFTGRNPICITNPFKQIFRLNLGMYNFVSISFFVKNKGESFCKLYLLLFVDQIIDIEFYLD